MDASGQSLFFNISFTNFIITTFSSLHLWFKILDNFWGNNKLLLKWWWCCCKDASTDDADGNAWSYLMQYVFLFIFHGCNVEMEMILRVWAKKMLLGGRGPSISFSSLCVYEIITKHSSIMHSLLNRLSHIFEFSWYHESNGLIYILSVVYIIRNIIDQIQS